MLFFSDLEMQWQEVLLLVLIHISTLRWSGTSQHACTSLVLGMSATRGVN